MVMDLGGSGRLDARAGRLGSGPRLDRVSVVSEGRAGRGPRLGACGVSGVGEGGAGRGPRLGGVSGV